MLADVDFSQIDVQEDVFHWSEWLASELGAAMKGMRFDAIKHYSHGFLKSLVEHLAITVGKDWFFVGEYWDSNLKVLANVIEIFSQRISLFDVQLVYNFSASSKAEHCDLTTMFYGTLAKHYPGNAVTFVQNHDTQETQALEAVVEEWFVPLAYAMILLRKDVGYPCVFYGDLYGIRGPKPRRPACGGKLPRLVLARKMYAYGTQREYAGEAECIGWTREGSGPKNLAKSAGVAVVLNTGWSWKEKKMNVGKHHGGEVWTDVMRWAWGEVQIDQTGEGLFPVGHRSISVWVNKSATGRKKMDDLAFDSDIYEAEKDRRNDFLRWLDNSPTVAAKLKI
jgi:alpha-amylase